jgi:hypothetical protein
MMVRRRGRDDWWLLVLLALALWLEAKYIASGMRLLFYLNDRVPSESIRPGQVIAFGIRTSPEGFMTAIVIVIALFIVLVFHALRRETPRVKVACGIGAVIFGWLAFTMVWWFLVMLFSI